MEIAPTVYPSVEAVVEDLTTELPLLEAIKATMEELGDDKRESEMYAGVCGMVKMLKDQDGFRQILELLKRPDSSVQFAFTREAWKLFRQLEGTA